MTTQRWAATVGCDTCGDMFDVDGPLCCLGANMFDVVAAIACPRCGSRVSPRVAQTVVPRPDHEGDGA